MASEETERRSVGIVVLKTKSVDMLGELARRRTRKASVSTVAKHIRMKTVGLWRRTKTNDHAGGASARVQSKAHQQWTKKPWSTS